MALELRRPIISMRPAEPDDLLYLAANLREADRIEMIAGTLQDPIDVMGWTMRHADEAWVGCADEVVGCMFGVTGTSIIYGGQGSPWLFTTPLIEKHARVFLRVSRNIVAQMEKRYPYLENFVDARNTVAIKWLRWLGFELDEPEPYGCLDRPFHRFHKGSLV